MARSKSFAFVSFSYLFALIFSLVTAYPGYEPISKFNVDRLLNVRWYQQVFWADGWDVYPEACTIWEFHTGCTASKRIIYFQLGSRFPDPEGNMDVGGTAITPTHVEGSFKIISATVSKNFDIFYLVLDHAPDYSWIIWADTFNEQGYLTVLSKNPHDEVARARGVELAEKYELHVTHEIQHDDERCDYDAVSKRMRELRCC